MRRQPKREDRSQTATAPPGSGSLFPVSGRLQPTPDVLQRRWASVYGATWNVPVTLREWIDGDCPYLNVKADCIELLSALPDKSVDLVFGSPPYEGQRSYGLEDPTAKLLTGEGWVEWMVRFYAAAVRVCRGVVGLVVQGCAEETGVWSAVPLLLGADLKRQGYNVWCPPLYKRNGLPGSGGNQRWRIDYEFCICVSPPKLPYSANTETGTPPKYGLGGAMSNQTKSGRTTRGKKCTLPKLANPGNVIDCGAVGGGHMGGALAHSNEAPFPLKVPLAFVACYSPPGGIVVDPFSGSATTGVAALSEGRRYLGGDVRPDQVALADSRCLAYV